MDIKKQPTKKPEPEKEVQLVTNEQLIQFKLDHISSQVALLIQSLSPRESK